MNDDAAWRRFHDDDLPIRIGVSSCLLGEDVRYDGGHKRDAFLVDILGPFVNWVPVCPEVEMGLGVPRPTIRLAAQGGDVRLVEPESGEDHTEAMRRFARDRIEALLESGLDGYVLKRGSPSCGMERVNVWSQKRQATKTGVGLFAARLLEADPSLPAAEEGRLNDLSLREQFVERVFCRNRLRALKRRGLSRSSLAAFHTAHEMLLRAHDEAGYRELGRIVDELGGDGDRRAFAAYESAFARTLARRTTVTKHANVLRHALVRLKRELDPVRQRRLLAAIEDYRRRLVPLIVPISLLAHEVEGHAIDELRGQLYLEPHPSELMLRNHS